MLEKHLHIISLTVPYPADYGGVYDLFYKLRALQQQGVNIHLHCFDYGRGEQPTLNKYCASVHYYKRNTGYQLFLYDLPYIVSSRKNETLLGNLLKDDHPVLMEGIHCTYLLNDERFADRKKFVRLHNVEYEYYNSLSASSKSPLQKLYFSRESRLLKKYEQSAAGKADGFFAVSPADRDLYNNIFGCRSIEYLPLFLPAEWTVKYLQGMGSYCLYHGDLSVQMNENAAVWLMTKIFKELKIPLLIAGKNPSKKLHRLAESRQQACIVANPTEEIMQDIIAKAHINILPSLSTTGIKIKLLNALYNGRHCVVNTPTVHGTGLEALCHVTDTADAMKLRIEALYHQPFTQQENEERRAVLSQMFCNERNAKKMVDMIW